MCASHRVVVFFCRLVSLLSIIFPVICLISSAHACPSVPTTFAFYRLVLPFRPTLLPTARVPSDVVRSRFLLVMLPSVIGISLISRLPPESTHNLRLLSCATTEIPLAARGRTEFAIYSTGTYLVTYFNCSFTFAGPLFLLLLTSTLPTLPSPLLIGSAVLFRTDFSSAD